jgi:hypothetical protein
MDRYYSSQKNSLPPLDLWLTLLTCFFIQLKFTEIKPIELDELVTYTSRRYNHGHFLKKEIDVMVSIDCELIAPHSLDFLMFYFRIMRLKL